MQTVVVNDLVRNFKSHGLRADYPVSEARQFDVQCWPDPYFSSKYVRLRLMKDIEHRSLSYNEATVRHRNAKSILRTIECHSNTRVDILGAFDLLVWLWKASNLWLNPDKHSRSQEWHQATKRSHTYDAITSASLSLFELKGIIGSECALRRRSDQETGVQPVLNIRLSSPMRPPFLLEPCAHIVGRHFVGRKGPSLVSPVCL